MRRVREVALLTLALVLASMPALALPSPPSGPFQDHPPIVITSDAHFTAANGVRSGNGTVGDPFVISGWSFSSGTTGIRIEGQNVTAAWLVLENQFSTSTGIAVKNTASNGTVRNNQFLVRTAGVSVTSADPLIVDNSFIGDLTAPSSRRGVDLVSSNARVESNAFLYVQFGVKAERGSPTILCNDIHDDVVVAGISVKYTTNATIACNIMTQCTLGIDAYMGIGTVIVNNSVDACYGGISAVLVKDVTIANNTLDFSLNAQLKVQTTSGNVTGNLIVDGRAEGAVIAHSPVLFANNTVRNHLGVGVKFEGTSGNASGNVVTYNSVGLKLVAGSVVTLHANVLANNTIGLDIPYESRQAFVNMSGNVVNGFNVDGSVNASQKVLFYKAANVTVQGLVLDSGFSAGYYGSLTAQGQIVLYEVDTATIEASVVSHGSVGVAVVNSFNVNVNDSLLVSNLVGVKAEVRAGVGPVPNCVVSVKRTNITIPVDPVATFGVSLAGCLGIVADVNVSVVDVGIRADASAGLFLSNSTVTSTRIGLDVSGQPHLVNISGNAFVGNRIGAKLSGTVGIFAENVVQRNAEVGIRLENGARLDLLRNNVSLNGEGLVDMEACAGPLTCSTLDARNNSFYANAGDGVRVQGATSWRGDSAVGNEGDGFELSSAAEMRGVRASDNEGDGARILGSFHVRDSQFVANEDDGLDITGEGELLDSNFTHNRRAGIRAISTYITAFHVNASHNFDGIVASEDAPGPSGVPVSVPGLLGLVFQGSSSGALGPLDVHRSALIGNERDAIRAGYAIVNATHNFFGSAEGPRINVGDTVGAFQNSVSPLVRFVPYYVDPEMTTTGPAPFL